MFALKAKYDKKINIIELFNNVKILDALRKELHNVTIMETETATFDYQNQIESIGGERVWWHNGRQIEEPNERLERYSDLKLFLF